DGRHARSPARGQCRGGGLCAEEVDGRARGGGPPLRVVDEVRGGRAGRVDRDRHVAAGDGVGDHPGDDGELGRGLKLGDGVVAGGRVLVVEGRGAGDG